MAAPANPKLRHFTTRRGFVIFVGLLVLTLYFMWAGYGAAPTSLSFLDETGSESMGGHGSGTGAMTPEEFHEITTKFAEDLSLPDGSVRPMRQWMVSMAAMGGGREDRDDEAGEHRDKDEAPGHGSSMMGTDDDGKTEREHDQTDAIKPSEAASMASSTEMPAVVTRQHKEAKGADEEEEPIDVYLMAMQFSYIPRVLRLEKRCSLSLPYDVDGRQPRRKYSHRLCRVHYAASGADHDGDGHDLPEPWGIYDVLQGLLRRGPQPDEGQDNRQIRSSRAGDNESEQSDHWDSKLKFGRQEVDAGVFFRIHPGVDPGHFLRRNDGGGPNRSFCDRGRNEL